jgi:sugar/nucleoside kinase (ribokinase family)
VLLLGDLMIDVSGDAEDLLVDEEVEGRLGVAPGGQPFGVAAWLLEAGCRPVVAAALSRGPSGAAFQELARPYGIELAPQLRDGEQGVVLLLRHPGGEASKVAAAGVAPEVDELDPALVTAADAVYISGYALARRRSRAAAVALCAAAAAHGRPLFVDLASRLAAAELDSREWTALLAEARPAAVFATAAELAALLGSEAPPTGTAVVVKHGAAGATLLAGGALKSFDAASGEVVDASGCGDALAAGFIACILAGGDAAAGVEAGIALAGRCAGRRGTLPAPRGATGS